MDFVQQLGEANAEYEALKMRILVIISTLQPGDSFVEELLLIHSLLDQVVSTLHLQR